MIEKYLENCLLIVAINGTQWYNYALLTSNLKASLS